MTNETRWDFGEQVVTKRPVKATFRGENVISSAAHVVFAALVILASGEVVERGYAASIATPVLERITVPRMDIHSPPSKVTDDDCDTNVGMSSGRLAEQFAMLFRPMDDVDEPGEPVSLD